MRTKRLLPLAATLMVLAGLTVLAAGCDGGARPVSPGVSTPTPSPSPYGTITETASSGWPNVSDASVCAGPPPRLETAAVTLVGREPPAVPAGFIRGIYSIDRDGKSPQLLTERRYLPPAGGEPGPPNTYQWSPDGTRIAFLATDERSRRTVSLLDVSTGSVTSVPSPDVVWGFSWSPDGALLAMQASAGDKEGLYVANLDIGTTTLVFPLQAGDAFLNLAPAWSPNGQCLALGLQKTTAIARPDGTHITTIPNAYQAVWSPDGLRMAFAASDGGVYVYDLVAGETSPKLAEGFPVSWHPDGERVVFEKCLEESKSSAIFAVSREGGAPVKLAEGSAPAWSPDGTILAFIRDGNLHVIAGGEERQLTYSPYSYIQEPRWSPDGQHLTFSYTPGTSTDVYVARADGTEGKPLAPGVQAKWSPTGQRIAFVLGSGGLGFGGSIYTVDTDGRAVARVATVLYTDAIPPCLGDLSYAWSPDGSLIAFVTYGSAIGQGGSFVVSADVSSPPVKIGDGFGSTWSADGKRLAFSAMQGPLSTDCMIFLTDASGAEREPLTAGVSPAWSPDGTRVAFLRQDGLYVINADGSGERRVAGFESRLPAIGPTIAWSPDGQKLAFSRDRYSEPNIPVAEAYVADLSSDQAPLDLGEGGNPVWLPDGQRIAVVVYENNTPHVDIVSADGSGARQRFLEASQVDWSPDGSQIVFTR